MNLCGPFFYIFMVLIYDLFEATTGIQMVRNYIRIGGVIVDLIVSEMISFYGGCLIKNQQKDLIYVAFFNLQIWFGIFFSLVGPRSFEWLGVLHA